MTAGARKNEGEGPMTVWVELQNGTEKIYKNVNRIVERRKSGNSKRHRLGRQPSDSLRKERDKKSG
jgi:hypothetical protein